jgi:pyruvate kinase
VFDDGKLAGAVVDTDPFAVTVLLDSAPPGGAELRRAKGINLPDTPHDLAALTPFDRSALRLLAPAVDAVSLSFVREAADVVGLRRELDALHRSDLPIIVKIETAQGFRNLPAIIAAGVASGPFGVMIARGDLAVEIGYERLAEVQEEILWLCESAHVPTIWATQVLNTMTKKGRPSRSEITDAAMASRAECVMLNKGPHIEDALHLLDGILRRMSGHQDKKRSLMRQLRAWGDVAEQPAAVPEVDDLIA